MAGSGFASRHVFFFLAASVVLMASIDDTIVSVAIPQLTAAFGVALVWVGWTINAYQLVQAIMLPLAGKLSDSFGRKRIFLYSVGMFTVGSLLCGLSPSIGWLIVARALQAIGGGGLMPSAVGVITDHYGKHRAQARGLFSSIFPLGGIIGPNIGGLILEHWSWRAMFFINVPIGIVVLLGVTAFLQSDQRARRALHVDATGLVMYSGAILLLLVAMTAAGDNPALWRSPLLWAAVVASIGLIVVFLRYIRRAVDPVMDYHLVVRQPFLAANLYALFYGAAVFGFTQFIPTYAVTHFGLSAFESGAVLTPRAIVAILTSILASFWIIRLGYRVPMLTGMALVTVTLLLLGSGWTSLQLGPVGVSGFWLLALMLVFGGIGNGLSGPSSSNAALDLAPEHAAALTGIRSLFRLTGGVICVAGIVLGVTFFPDEGTGLVAIFRVLSLLILVAVPLALMMPDTARERLLRARPGAAVAEDGARLAVGVAPLAPAPGEDA